MLDDNLNSNEDDFDKIIDPEIEEEKANLKLDIAAIDSRLIDITKNINLLQSNIDRITNILLTGGKQAQQNPNQSQNMGKFYTIQSELLKTLSGYNDNYEKLLNLKFKYRAEQNNLSLRVIRLYEVEMKKLYSDLESDEVNYKSVLNAISNMGVNAEQERTEIQFEDDEKI